MRLILAHGDAGYLGDIDPTVQDWSISASMKNAMKEDTCMMPRPGDYNGISRPPAINGRGWQPISIRAIKDMRCGTPSQDHLRCHGPNPSPARTRLQHGRVVGR